MPKVLNKYKDTGQPGIYIGRPSKWGNPFSLNEDCNREQAVQKYKKWIESNPALIAEAKLELAGRDLICFCAPKSCHGDVLLKIANGM